METIQSDEASPQSNQTNQLINPESKEEVDIQVFIN
jgi:hypothetical protein